MTRAEQLADTKGDLIDREQACAGNPTGFPGVLYAPDVGTRPDRSKLARRSLKLTPDFGWNPVVRPQRAWIPFQPFHGTRGEGAGV
jgi:hypothetical protein